MPFGRSAKPNNRSQHNAAVESAGPNSSTGSITGTGTGTTGTTGSSGSGSGAPATAVGLQGIGVSTPGAQTQLNHQQTSQGQQLQQQQQHHSQSPSVSSLGQGSSNLAQLTDSFAHDNRQLPPPPHHFYGLATGSGSGQDLPSNAQGNLISSNHSQAQAQAQLHPLNTGNARGVSDAEARKAASKFVDAVTRSQSQRYNQVATPIQPNPTFGASFEDLTRSLQAGNPQGQQQPFVYHHQHHQQPPPQQPYQPPLPQSAPVEPRRSTRRLIKNILGGNPRNDSSRSGHSHHPSESQSQSQPQAQNPSQHLLYDSNGVLPRRSSKRISNPNPPPPGIRTGPSQISLDQQSLDWQSQGHQSQPSPLQTVSRFAYLLFASLATSVVSLTSNCSCRIPTSSSSPHCDASLQTKTIRHPTLTLTTTACGIRSTSKPN